jgi:transposase InsO family protein
MEGEEGRNPVPDRLTLVRKSLGTGRGTQFAAKHYRVRLEAMGVQGSMGRTGNPYDNAQVERFFKTLKHEEVYAFEYETMQDVLERLPTFLEETYNQRRLHSSLGYVPPEEYEHGYTMTGGTFLNHICPPDGVHSTGRDVPDQQAYRT